MLNAPSSTLLASSSPSSRSIERPSSSFLFASKKSKKQSLSSKSSSSPGKNWKERSFAERRTFTMEASTSEQKEKKTKKNNNDSIANTNLTKLGLTALAACAAVHCADPAFALDSETSEAMMRLAGDTCARSQDHVSGLHDYYNEALSQTGMAGEDIPFWANMAKYARFSISIMVGFVYMFARPVAKLLKEPKTAVLVVVAAIGGFQFFKWTITEMLAMNDPESFM